jgi:hypothetical protein
VDRAVIRSSRVGDFDVMLRFEPVEGVLYVLRIYRVRS